MESDALLRERTIATIITILRLLADGLPASLNPKGEVLRGDAILDFFHVASCMLLRSSRREQRSICQIASPQKKTRAENRSPIEY